MKIASYSKVNKSTTSGIDSFKRNLRTYYGEVPIVFQNIKSLDGNNFVIVDKPIKILEKEFHSLIKKALDLRETNLEDYLSSGYIVSEINSSLKAEGVNSSRKIVDIVIKSKLDGKALLTDEITKLISNYYEALRFVLNRNKITKRNILTLYSILTSDLDNVIEDEWIYRKRDVFIGEDKGADPKDINDKMDELISFINSNVFEDRIQTKAIIAHYLFENIHPYYDYNGRMGRLLHLWILINHSPKEFWKLIFLSEAIYAYKEKFDTTFRKITKAKKNKANIDLTFFVGMFYEILIDHTKAYIKMKNMTNTMKKAPSRHLRLFIIDLLTIKGADNKWYTINEFKKRYPDYSKTVNQRLLKEISTSNLFEIRNSKPKQFRFKK